MDEKQVPESFYEKLLQSFLHFFIQLKSVFIFQNIFKKFLLSRA